MSPSPTTSGALWVGIGLSHVTLMIQFVNKPKTPEREIPPQRSLFGDFRD
jgi:hypothetical protein